MVENTLPPISRCPKLLHVFSMFTNNVTASTIALAGLATVTSLSNIYRLPHVDELYTILAARGYNATGLPVIADGIYTRATIYTWLTAKSLQVFGDTLIAARLPALISGVILTISVFLILRSQVGTLAAWISALFVALSPLTVGMFQFARFYALHALVFWIAACMVYFIIAYNWGLYYRILLAMWAMFLFFIALRLQDLTIVGTIALCAWVALFILDTYFLTLRAHIYLLLTLIICVGAIAIVDYYFFHVFINLWRDYRSFSLDAKATANQFWFYHVLLIEHYPSLWPITPFLALVVIYRHPKFGLFLSIVFTTILVLLSFGGMKHQRYIVFGLAFLFSVWGIALSIIGPSVASKVWRLGKNVSAHRLIGQRKIYIGFIVVVVGYIFLIGSNGASTKTTLRLFGLDLLDNESELSLSGKPDAYSWQLGRSELMDLIKETKVVITSRDLYALYFLGRSDITLNRDILSQIKQGKEFSRDPRTGKLVIGTAESLEMIMQCMSSGVLITDKLGWQNPIVLDQAAASLIRGRMEQYKLRTSDDLIVYRWSRDEADKDSDECERFRHYNIK